MSDTIFTAEKSIIHQMHDYNRTTAIELGISMCRAMLETEFHGAICPEAVMLNEDGTAVFDAPLEGEITSLSAQALEYAAPELFWHDDRSISADIYAIGLILYCAMNGGNQPFQPLEGEFGIKERADALRRRMKGEAITPLANTGIAFGEIIMRATSYEKSDRFASISEMLEALEKCPVLPLAFIGFTPAAIFAENPELAKALDAEMGTNSVAEAAEREKLQKEFKVAKDFEKNLPKEEKPKKKRGLIILCAIAAAALISVAVFSAMDKEGDLPEVTPSVAVTPSITPEVTPTPEPTPEVTETPEVSPEVTDEPIFEPIPTPTAQHVVEGDYTMVLENVSWTQAKENAKTYGGTLATVRSQDELNTVIAMAESLGADYVWLGAERNLENGEMVWCSGEMVDFYAWGNNEPSYKDGYDGTAENYMLLWNVNFGGDNGWVYNDSRNDLYNYSPQLFGGKIAYIYEIG